MIRKIDSWWKWETSPYSDELGFYDRQVTKREIVTLTMEISANKESKLILYFRGGPTGFESYYLGTLMNRQWNHPNHAFCICGGTINSWPSCHVDYQEVLDFINYTIGA